jgi:hypothetical protein
MKPSPGERLEVVLRFRHFFDERLNDQIRH